MAAKTEEKPKDAPADKAAAAAPAAPAASPLKALLPALAALVLAPAASWATAEFVILPRLQKKLSAPAAGEAAAAPAAGESHGKEGGHGKDAKGEGKEGAPDSTYEFANVVVNLSGTMGTRYLKVSFLVTGTDVTLKGQFETQKPRLTDVTLSVLSSLTLADLEEPGSKNVLREKLVAAYNQTLGKRIVEQVYFSDFVIQ